MAGLGAIGLLHARHIAHEVCGARLVCVVDQDRALGEAAAGELGVSSSTSFEAVLEDPAVAAVVIATPSPLHAAMVEQAARAGKHVFCEKPLSLDVASGERASAAAATAGISLQIGFQRRFDPGFAEARRRIAVGELGDVLLLRISHRNRVPPHDGPLATRLGSPFVDMTIHDFDTALWLVGPVSEVQRLRGHRLDARGGPLRERRARGDRQHPRARATGSSAAAELVGTLRRCGSGRRRPQAASSG